MSKLPENPDKTAKGRFPKWLHLKLLPDQGYETNALLRKYNLNTVCEEAKCPNRHECFSKGTATFLALGKECTRACGFCDIDFDKAPKPPEADEPQRIALSVKELGLSHAVITMVARDDLPDQGASHIAKILQAIRIENPNTTCEVLTSDFQGNLDALNIVLDAKPEIFNHNIETVRALSPRVRHKATYERTLSILKAAKGNVPHLKSGIMVGLGETPLQVEETISDLYSVGVDIITIGQYLKPNTKKLSVKSFVTPDQFDAYAAYGLSIGVPHMYCGPFVRSSYNANLLKEKVYEHSGA